MRTLHKVMQSRNVMFQHNHNKPMSCKATAQLLSNTLYHKRFFPYFTFNLCAGLDEEGKLSTGAAHVRVCLARTGSIWQLQSLTSTIWDMYVYGNTFQRHVCH